MATHCAVLDLPDAAGPSIAMTSVHSLHFASLVVDREYNYLAARIEQHCAAHLRPGR